MVPSERYRKVVTWLVAAGAWAIAEAHCPVDPPHVQLSHPQEGMAVQEACYPEFSSCLVDTFHVDSLRSRLAERYRAKKFAVFATMDSLKHYETFDTTYYKGQIYYIDTFQTEQVHIRIHASLKDALPVTTLTFIDRWQGFTATPYATTYLALLDTPFVAFFDAYDYIHELGIGPMDGCFFEPTAFMIHGNRIHSRGLAGDRMPGVSITLEDFFHAIGRDPVPAPPVSLSRYRARRSSISLPIRRYRFDLNGRRWRP